METPLDGVKAVIGRRRNCSFDPKGNDRWHLMRTLPCLESLTQISAHAKLNLRRYWPMSWLGPASAENNALIAIAGKLDHSRVQRPASSVPPKSSKFHFCKVALAPLAKHLLDAAKYKHHRFCFESRNFRSGGSLARRYPSTLQKSKLGDYLYPQIKRALTWRKGRARDGEMALIFSIVLLN